MRRGEDEIVADACAYGWLRLVRRADVRLDRHGFSWLALVAIQEAWRLTRERPEQPPGGLLPTSDHEDELPEPVSPTTHSTA